MDTVQANEVLAQIGHMNVLAISGGRKRLIDGALVLPVARGYSVRITLDEGSDTYTVQRVFARAGKEWTKGERNWVHCDEVSEAAYRAACYHDEW